MSTQRYISSSFWSDDWVDSLSIKEKLLYMYLLTNEHTNIAGVYKITVKRIKDDTGITRAEVESALAKFSKNKKAFYINEYIIIPKWPKHQKLGERGTLRLGVNTILKNLPQNIKDFIMQPGNYEYDISFLSVNSDTPYIPHIEKEQKPDGVSIPPNALSDDSDVDLDSDSDLDSDVDLLVDAGKTSTTTINTKRIKEMAKLHGFFISTKQANNFLKLEPSWFVGDYNFIAFATSKICEDTTKTHGDHERIFSKSWSYENFIQEYPEWIKNKKAEFHNQENKRRKEKKEQERLKEIEKAMNYRPVICSHCGATVNDINGGQGKCESCGWHCIFNEKYMAWEFSEPKSLSEEYKRQIKDKNGGGNEN